MAKKFTSPKNRILFNQQVWQIVSQIPVGKVATYGQIAEMITPSNEMNPKSYLAFGARWVGGAMANCPANIPWQRVVNSQGKVSPRPGAMMQRELLESEGIVFDERDRINLKVFGWEGY